MVHRIVMLLPIKLQSRIAAVSIAAAIIVAGGCGSKHTDAPPVSNAVFLAQKARESGGDFSKLSPADQKEVQGRTQGHGPQALRSWARHLAHP